MNLLTTSPKAVETLVNGQLSNRNLFAFSILTEIRAIRATKSVLSRLGLGCFTQVTKFFFTLCGLMPHECAQHEPKFPKVNCVVIAAKARGSLPVDFHQLFMDNCILGGLLQGKPIALRTRFWHREAGNQIHGKRFLWRS